jgi:hypothetical protein
MPSKCQGGIILTAYRSTEQVKSKWRGSVLTLVAPTSQHFERDMAGPLAATTATHHLNQIGARPRNMPSKCQGGPRLVEPLSYRKSSCNFVNPRANPSGAGASHWSRRRASISREISRGRAASAPRHSRGASVSRPAPPPGPCAESLPGSTRPPVGERAAHVSGPGTGRARLGGEGLQGSGLARLYSG